MLERAAAGRPSVLVSSWPGPVVVLGYAQPADDADLEWCRRKGIPVLRRLSGGTGVIHRGDLAVALALPKEHSWTEGIVSLYDRFLAVLQPALKEAGSRAEVLVEPRRGSRIRSPICFEDQLADSLVVDGRKAVGCSQTRRKGCVLIHAVILLDLDPELYARVFRIDVERVRNGLAPAVTGVAWEKVADLVLRRLACELELDFEVVSRPDPSDELLAGYREERWAPVPDGGMRSPRAGLV